MAKKSKAKWLAEATTRELIVLMKECIKDEDFKKVNKIIAELLERIPEEESTLTIEEIVEKLKKDLDAILEVYNQEAAAVVEDKDQDDDDDDEDEDDEEDDDEDEDEDDEEDEGYEDMTQGELKKELRRRGIKVTKSMKKADMIRALEADDEE